MRIRFDIPADPDYPGRVAAALSRVRLRWYRRIGVGLVAVGTVGFVVTRWADWGAEVWPL